jgi:catechol 2,3-dioxygenase-like lactoylglutathione lyase family enzyme
MDLGAFSVSLAVKDLAASRAFYEKLGFRSVMGEPTQNWLILRNGTTTLGLFQGMFDRNILTFNPGWTGEAKPRETFTDVREIQKALKAAGLRPAPEADESSTGPASLMLTDPDGNPVLLDQHVPRPSR